MEDNIIPGGLYFKTVGKDTYEPIDCEGRSLGPQTKYRDKFAAQYRRSFLPPDAKNKLGPLPSDDLTADIKDDIGADESDENDESDGEQEATKSAKKGK